MAPIPTPPRIPFFAPPYVLNRQQSYYNPNYFQTEPETTKVARSKTDDMGVIDKRFIIGHVTYSVFVVVFFIFLIVRFHRWLHTVKFPRVAVTRTPAPIRPTHPMPTVEEEMIEMHDRLINNGQSEQDLAGIV